MESTNQSKKGINWILIITLVIVVLIVGFLISISLQTTNGKSKEAAIKVAMSQLRVAAELHYEKENSYIDFRNDTDIADITGLKKSIEECGGTELAINISHDGVNYCAEVRMPSPPNWRCIDDRGAYDLTDNPVCSEDFFACVDKTTDWQTYRNEEYGFEIILPNTWRGYSILEEDWSGRTLAGEDTEFFEGPQIVIRHPEWTVTQLWQDIPIMVFTKNEWNLIEENNLNVSAAPIGPSKLGENQEHVFASPPRWIGYTDNLGQDEAGEIIETFEAF